ncbi:MAG: protein-tyrosine-phosphatase, partial [Planctomycetota bacterium]|nr:protein-tyrosine-phosphatase [Planctomycetota bacterium]
LMTSSFARANLFPQLEQYLNQRKAEFNQIDPSRRLVLEPLAKALARELQGDKDTVDVTFVCTHNSRRSHMSQLWMKAAAESLQLPLTTWSGGTESTAMNPRAVASLRRAGFEITQTTKNRNPIYHVSMGKDAPTQTCFSKPWSSPPNPTSNFFAVMVCNDADQKCPTVPGATDRFAIPFVDPKVSDGTEAESATYDGRSAQIAREFLWVAHKTKELLGR